MFNLNGSDISGVQIEGGIILHPDIKEASVVPVALSVYFTPPSKNCADTLIQTW